MVGVLVGGWVGMLVGAQVGGWLVGYDDPQFCRPGRGVEMLALTPHRPAMSCHIAGHDRPCTGGPARDQPCPTMPGHGLPWLAWQRAARGESLGWGGAV